jgi:hypothetical protein
VKRFIVAASVGVAILTLPVAAWSEEKTTAEEISDAAWNAWEWIKDTSQAAWDSATSAFDTAIETTDRQIIVGKDLPQAISGKKLLGTPIENAKDGTVGRLSDIVYGDDNRLDAVVVAEGGFLGIGADDVPMKPQLLTIHRQADGSYKGRTNATEKQLENAGDAAFVSKIEALDENYDRPTSRRLKAYIGSSVEDKDGKKVASVDDVLLSPTGEAKYAILSLNTTKPERRVVVSISSLKFVRDDAPLTSSRNLDQLKKLASVHEPAEG